MAEKAKEENKEEEEKSQYEQLTSTQKCAILMMLLGEEEASEILKNLGPKEVQQLGKEMYNVQGLDQDTVNKLSNKLCKSGYALGNCKKDVDGFDSDGFQWTGVHLVPLQDEYSGPY